MAWTPKIEVRARGTVRDAPQPEPEPELRSGGTALEPVWREDWTQELSRWDLTYWGNQSEWVVRHDDSSSAELHILAGPASSDVEVARSASAFVPTLELVTQLAVLPAHALVTFRFGVAAAPAQWRIDAVGATGRIRLTLAEILPSALPRIAVGNGATGYDSVSMAVEWQPNGAPRLVDRVGIAYASELTEWHRITVIRRDLELALFTDRCFVCWPPHRTDRWIESSTLVRVIGPDMLRTLPGADEPLRLRIGGAAVPGRAAGALALGPITIHALEGGNDGGR